MLDEQDESGYVFSSFDITWYDGDSPDELCCAQCKIDESAILVFSGTDQSHAHAQVWRTARAEKEEELLAIGLQEQRGCALIDWCY